MKLKGHFRIAISGKSGCGNSTVGKLLTERIEGMKQINYTLRSMAEDLKMPFDELRRLAEETDKYDIELDDKQVSLAMAEDFSVLNSRLAIWVLKNADLKVYLDIPANERFKRIYKREKENGKTLDEVILKNSQRDALDYARYKKIYGFDTNDYSHADIIIKSPYLSAEQICDIIIAAIPKELK